MKTVLYQGANLRNFLSKIMHNFSASRINYSTFNLSG